MSKSITLRIPSGKVAVAMDSMTAPEFLGLVAQADDASVRRLVKALGKVGGDKLLSDLEKLKNAPAPSGVARQSLEVPISTTTVKFKLTGVHASVYTDGTAGYKGVEMPMEIGSK